MNCPVGWVKGTLGRLCSIEIGGTPSRNIPEYWDVDSRGNNHWVSIRDMSQDVIFETAELISDLGVKHSNVKLQDVGTILLSFKLTIGKVSVAGVRLYTNEAIAGIRSQEIDEGFMFFGLQHWDLLKGVDQAVKGATLNKKKLKQIEFCYPVSHEEQSKIVEIMVLVDKAAKKSEAIIAKQQRIKAGLMQDLLTKGIDAHGNIRSEETHEFKDSTLGRIPAEWEVATVGSKLLVPPKNGYSPVEADSWTGIGMLGLGCLTKDGFVLSQVKNAPEADKKIHKAILDNGDFLISRSNTRDLVGLVGVFSNPGYPCIYPDLMVRLHFNADVSSEYMQHVFQCGVVRRQLQKNATGTSESMVKITAKVIKNVIFQCPSVSEQSRINDVIFAQQKTVQEAMTIHGKLLSIKTGLMHDLLTGTVPVTNLLDEASPT